MSEGAKGYGGDLIVLVNGREAASVDDIHRILERRIDRLSLTSLR